MLGTRPRPIAAAAVAAVAGGLALPATAAAVAGHVYTLTNASDRNAVVVFDRAADGALQRSGTFATGGGGTGAGLGSQGALALARGGRYLIAVNAGSDELTSFAVSGGRLVRVSVVSSHGDMPISVAAHGGLVYALDAGGDGRVTGFHLRDDGRLRHLRGSSRPLSQPAPGPAQIAFRPGGGALVVTEKTTDTIDTYGVDASGRAHGPRAHASGGSEPFGFAFASDGRLLVSDAVGGAPGASGLSSYRVGSSGGLATVTAFLGNGQTAACWVAFAEGAGVAYTANTGSGTVSAYRVGRGGALHLLRAVAGSTGAGSAPADTALAGHDRFAYVLDEATGRVVAFRRAAGGTLLRIGRTGVRGAGGAGLVAS